MTVVPRENPTGLTSFLGFGSLGREDRAIKVSEEFNLSIIRVNRVIM